VKLDVNARVSDARGDIEAIWGQERIKVGTPIATLIPHVPMGTSLDPINISSGISDMFRLQHFTAQTAAGVAVPMSITKLSGPRNLRISSFPHIAGVMVVDPDTLTISSSNAVFSAALFGHEKLDGLPITYLIPKFDEILQVLTEEDDVDLVDGIVIPEHSFRRARALLASREKNADAANIFFRPPGLLARRRDGSQKSYMRCGSPIHASFILVVLAPSIWIILCFLDLVNPLFNHLQDRYPLYPQSRHRRTAQHLQRRVHKSLF
jgi:protein-serine/threonine kinase